MEYKPTLVGFLDILGFSTTCLQTESSIETRANEAKEKIETIFKVCREIPRGFDNLLGKKKIKSIVVSD